MTEVLLGITVLVLALVVLGITLDNRRMRVKSKARIARNRAANEDAAVQHGKAEHYKEQLAAERMITITLESDLRILKDEYEELKRDNTRRAEYTAALVTDIEGLKRQLHIATTECAAAQNDAVVAKMEYAELRAYMNSKPVEAPRDFIGEHHAAQQRAREELLELEAKRDADLKALNAKRDADLKALKPARRKAAPKQK